MNEFTTRTNRLRERLQRGLIQCDYIEERACIAEKRLLKLDRSIQNLARLIEVSFLLLISSDKEKLMWLQLINDKNEELTSPIFQQFFSRLESYLKREIFGHDERQGYIHALFLLQSSSIISSGFLE
jgi:hypothetical protein